MKKIVIIDNTDTGIDKETLLSGRGYSLVLRENPSIIDLPAEIARIVISNNDIVFKVISWCMFPVIWAGDTLKIEPIKPEEARVGDIVLYKFQGRAFAHRLVKIYEKENRLYAVTSGENEYTDNRLDSGGSAINADNILGRVIEIKRGRTSLPPFNIKIGLLSLISGRLRISLAEIGYKTKNAIIKIFAALQKFRSYRYVLKKLIKNKISFFIGIPIMAGDNGIDGLYTYQKIDDFSKDLSCNKSSYNISAKIYNVPAGNIGLFFKINEISLHEICILSNFIIKAPFRGAGIGQGLLERALDLCNKMAIHEVRAVLHTDDRIGLNLFKKAGFDITNQFIRK